MRLPKSNQGRCAEVICGRTSNSQTVTQHGNSAPITGLQTRGTRFACSTCNSHLLSASSIRLFLSGNPLVRASVFLRSSKTRARAVRSFRLYRSWAEMLRSQPPLWRTDFIIFTYNFSAEFRSLGCVNRIRQTKDEPSVCRLFLYIPIKFRTKNLTDNHFRHAFDDARRIGKIFKDDVEHMVTIPVVNDTQTFDVNRSQLLFDNLRSYGYVDSINTVYEGYSTFKMYDFVLRTDIGERIEMFVVRQAVESRC